MSIIINILQIITIVSQLVCIGLYIKTLIDIKRKDRDLKNIYSRLYDLEDVKRSFIGLVRTHKLNDKDLFIIDKKFLSKKQKEQKKEIENNPHILREIYRELYQDNYQCFWDPLFEPSKN